MVAVQKLLLLVVACSWLGSIHAEEHKLPAPASMPPMADSENKFLKYLFNKYGSKGVISFEGLEHLMHSLGLGGLDFAGSHTLKEHRPDGYDFSDYDVFGEPHHEHESASPEPPVITFATEPVANSAARPASQHNHHHHKDDEHLDGVEPRRNSTTGGPSKKPSGEHVAFNGTTLTPPVVTVHHPRTPDHDADDHVWQEIIFKDMHDPHHRHPRNKNVPFCLSPMSIVHLVMEEPLFGKQQDSYRKARSLAHAHTHDENQPHSDEIDSRIEITPSEFKDLCPAFLVQLDQRACSQKLNMVSNPLREKKTFSQAWIYASACVLLISVCGLVCVVMVPLAKSIAYDDILRFLIALGVGTLCGDALMHLLPHALFPHDHDHEDHHHHEPHDDHDHGHEAETRAMWLCLCAFGTAFFMYGLEMILPLFRDGEGHQHHHHGHSHGSNRVEPSAPQAPSNQQQGAGNYYHQRGEDIELDLTDAVKEKEAKTMLQKDTSRKPMAAVAFMVVLGDGLHNITDGLAIGAAFAIAPVTGLATSFAILCHELPHELGDFALLLQTGVSIRRAIYLNIVSSVLSFIGMALGLVLTELDDSVVGWINAGTAGTFLYIALADLVPEMRNDVAKSEQKLKIILIQLVGIALGAIIMLLIALNEGSLQALFD
ncbi:zinc transporter ZIP10 [Anopheles nili]|uniref:zinc transporter ZIP10 n=1 Tax=Anopheles nili TaxID=185578 RepID=UPI00237B9351|nr:zinc transporter ZIP10 [Anopheles nili]